MKRVLSVVLATAFAISVMGGTALAIDVKAPMTAADHAKVCEAGMVVICHYPGHEGPNPVAKDWGHADAVQPYWFSGEYCEVDTAGLTYDGYGNLIVVSLKALPAHISDDSPCEGITCEADGVTAKTEFDQSPSCAPAS